MDQWIRGNGRSKTQPSKFSFASGYGPWPLAPDPQVLDLATTLRTGFRLWILVIIRNPQSAIRNSWTPHSALRTPKGFTLLELLLVLVILAIAAALVAPAIGTRFTAADPRLVIVQLRAAMELMRVRAIEEGKEEVLVIAPGDGRYWHEGGGEEVAVPPESGELFARGRFTRETGEVEFHFYPDGTNSGGEVRIAKRRNEGGKVYGLVLNPLLGTATVRREN